MKGKKELINLMAVASRRGGDVTGQVGESSGSIKLMFPDEIAKNDVLLERLQYHRNDLVRLVRSADRGN